LFDPFDLKDNADMLNTILNRRESLLENPKLSDGELRSRRRRVRRAKQFEKEETFGLGVLSLKDKPALRRAGNVSYDFALQDFQEKHGVYWACIHEGQLDVHRYHNYHPSRLERGANSNYYSVILMPGEFDDILNFVKFENGDWGNAVHERRMRELDRRQVVVCPFIRGRYKASLVAAKMADVDFFGEGCHDMMRDEAGCYQWTKRGGDKWYSTHDECDFYCGPTMTGKNARSGYKLEILYSRYWAKWCQEFHTWKHGKEVRGESICSVDSDEDQRVEVRFIFDYGRFLDQVLERALTTKLSTPKRRSIGQNPERIAKACEDCDAWANMVGTSARQTECVVCVKRKLLRVG